MQGKSEKKQFATLAIDTDGDGQADVICMGVDRDGDGMPDRLQKDFAQKENDRDSRERLHQAIQDAIGDHNLLPNRPQTPWEMAQSKALQIVSHPVFDGFILCLILINSILLALYQYRDPGCTFNWVSDNVIDPILLAFFTIECFLKIMAWGLVCSTKHHTAYLRDAWNWLDFVVVVTGWIFWIDSLTKKDDEGGGSGFSFLRVFRVLRPLRSLTMLPEMRVLVNTVLQSIPRLFNVTLMGLFIFMVFAIIGITLWGGIFYRMCRSTPNPTLSWAKDCWLWNASNPDDLRLCGGRHTCGSGSWCGGHPRDLDESYRPKFHGSEDGHLGLPWCNPQQSAWTGKYENSIDYPRKVFPETDFIHFDHIGGALLIVFQSMTMEGWTDIMYMVQDGSGNIMATAYFFMVILITSFFVLNVILAVIAESFGELDDAEEEMQKKAELLAEAEAEDARNGWGTKPIVVPPEPPWWFKMCSCCLPQNTKRKLSARWDARVSTESHLGVGIQTEDIWWDNKVVKTCWAIVDHEAFKYTILLIIAANVVVMMLDKFPPDLALKNFTDVCETVFLIVFALEMVMMITAMGPIRYVQNPLTCFDGFIVITCFIELLLTAGSALSIFRSFRLLRVVFKIANKWEDFRVLLKSIIKTMFSLGYFALLFLLVMYVLTLMGMSFFATEFHFTEDLDMVVEEEDGAVWCPGGGHNTDCIPRANFDTFIWAFTTVFQIMSGENWNTVMYDGMRTGKVLTAVFYFVFMIIFGQIMMLNLFLTILMDKFDKAQKDLKEEEKRKMELRKSQKKNKKIESLKQFHKEFSSERGVKVTSDDEEVRPPGSGTSSPVYTKPKLNEGKTSLMTCALAIADSKAFKKNGNDPLRDAAGSHEEERDSLEVVENLPGQVVERVPEPPPGSFAEEGKPAALQHIEEVPDQAQTLKAITSLKAQFSEPGESCISQSAALNDVGYMSSQEEVDDKLWRVVSAKTVVSDLGDEEWPRTYALLLFSRENPVRSICQDIVLRKEFEHFILLCILLSSIIMAIDSPLRDPSETFTKILKVCDRTFAIIFIIEMCMKVIAMGLCWGPRTYLKSAWNWIDALVVVVSIIDMTGLTTSVGFLRTLRILRAFRPLRVISRNQNLKVVVTTIFESLPELATLFIVAMLFLLIFALLFLAYFNGKFYGCTDGGDGIAVQKNMGEKFVTPLCLAAAANAGASVCPHGSYSGENEWTPGTCDTCSVQTIMWERPGPDTPICVGRCSSLRGPMMSVDKEPPEAICPKQLTKAEELPSVCPHGELNLESATPGKYFQDEEKGIHYVTAMLKDYVLPCAGPVAGAGCRDMFCPHKIGQPTSDSCKSECRLHPTFCMDECDKKSSGWESKKSAKCQECMFECEAWCECQDYCEPLAKDGALCVEQGERWGMTISQNFNTIMNSMTTLFEISTTEGWVDVMYEAVDAIDYYVQPSRDYNLIWAFAFIIYIFISNMFIINLSVGVIVDNFIQLKRAAKMVNADGVKVQTAIDGRKYCGRSLAKLAKCGSQGSLGRTKSGGSQDGSPPLIKTKSFKGEVCRPDFQCQACREYKEPCLTKKQAEWVEYQKGLFWLSEPFELTNLHQKAPSQKQLFLLISSPSFENTIMSVIIFNTLLMACNAFPAPTEWWGGMIEVAGYFFAFIFFLEFGVKFYALRSNYWKDSWNRFDFFCVVATAFGIVINFATDANIGTLMSVIRIFRVARLFRLLRFMKGVNKIFMALVYSLPKLANVSILLVLLLVLYSILGVQLFAKVKFSDTLNIHGNFQDFPRAFQTLFRSMTGEAWNEIMHDLDKDEKDFTIGPRIGDPKSWCSPPSLFDTDTESTFKILQDKCLIQHPNQCREYPYTSQIYFVSFTFILTFSVLNLVIAVILEGYEDGQEHTESDVIEVCRKLWKKYDPDYTLFIDFHEAFLYTDEVLREQGNGVADVDLPIPPIRPSATSSFGVDLARVPMKYANALDLKLTEDGKVHFHIVVKLVLRILVTKNDPACLAELEETHDKLSPTDAKRLRDMEKKQIEMNNLGDMVNKEGDLSLRAQVAASKIQKIFLAKQAKRKTRADLQRRFSNSNLFTTQEDEAEAVGSSIKAESVNTEDLPGTLPYVGSVQTVASVQPMEEGSRHVLLPRNPANVDGLDEPGMWRRPISVEPADPAFSEESVSLLRTTADETSDVLVLDPPPPG